MGLFDVFKKKELDFTNINDENVSELINKKF